MKNSPTVSVVIPSYNEATYIDRLLDALKRQQDVDFEVIIADAQSKDGTAKVVDSFKDRLDLTLVQSPPKGPANGRNEGAKRTRGEWLLFLDADIDLDDPRFIVTLVETAKRRGWSTASTRTRVKTPTLADRLGMAVHHRYLRLLARTKHPVAPGFCILTRRKVFEDNNGFDETLWVAEDYDYVSRTAREGFGFVDDTYYYVDLRRFREGGSLKVFAQSVGYEIYRFTHNYKIEKDPFGYKFGEHGKRK
jgi:glycosyltransferase involved in cell wall biosynthesis